MRNYKNIILILVLIIALGFLVFSVGFYLKKRSEVVVAPESQGAGSEVKTPVAAGQITYSEDWARGFGEARVAMDPEKCGIIAGAAERRDCQDKINLLLAYRDNDMNSCRAIFEVNLRDNCYTNLGLRLGADYCSYLSDAAVRKTCEEAKLVEEIVASGEINKCADLSGEIKNYCSRRIFQTYTAAGQCEVITNGEIKALCQDNFK
jgi:hypothetical protein